MSMHTNIVIAGLLTASCALLDARAAARSVYAPTAALTPGVENPHVTVAELCRPNYTAERDVRHVTEATKREVFRRYGLPWARHAHYEVDHLISLENGGANAIENLWPEPYCRTGNRPEVSGCWGAREKDVVETRLHRWMCQGRITRAGVVAILRGRWRVCYTAIQAGRACLGVRPAK